MCFLAAGVYNETVFQGVDYILATLAKHNIKAIINLLTCANFAQSLVRRVLRVPAHTIEVIAREEHTQVRSLHGVMACRA